MVRKKYSEEQIIAVLKEGEAGVQVRELCRKHGISDGACYNWKAGYAGMTVSELKRLKGLEDENRRPSREGLWVSKPSTLGLSRNCSQKTFEAQG